MARDDTKNGGNGGDDVKAERGMATLSTLRYVTVIERFRGCELNEYTDGVVCTGLAPKRWLKR